MTAANIQPAALPARKPWQLSLRATFFLQASITLSFLAGSSAPTPLYPIYAAQWHFSPVVITEIFGVYAAAVLASLLFAGRLSDHLGRRPVLVATAALQALAMLVFALADGVPTLIAARIIQGVAAGAALSAVGAGLLDIDRVRGSTANAVAPMVGTGAGALLTGLLLHFVSPSLTLVYALLGGVFVVQCVAAMRMPETTTPRSGALASLRPVIHLPANVRSAVVVATPVLIAAWALAGFYASLGPAVVRSLTGVQAPLLSGAALGVLAGSGALTVLLTQSREPRALMGAGALALLAGVALSLHGINLKSVPVYFVGTALSGAGFGAGFQGAIRTVMPQVDARYRAGVLSLLFVVCYVAMGVPALGAGYLLSHGASVAATARDFALFVGALAAIALVGMVASPRPARCAMQPVAAAR